MSELLEGRAISIDVEPNSPSLYSEVGSRVLQGLSPGELPIRFAVTESKGRRWVCELGVQIGGGSRESIFRFEQRTTEDKSHFNVVMLVPTGIGADVGGHAGDAAPAATLLASVCDTLVTHPNVLNASDLIQIPSNALYVEGSAIAQMLGGTAQLLPTRSNRVLVLVQSHSEQIFTDLAINAVNAARAYFGLTVTEVVQVDSNFRMISEYGHSGVAEGRIEGLDRIWSILDARQGQFDAVAITSVIELSAQLHRDYYDREGSIVNPWGGVEAMLTHAISLKYRVPAAHSPMFESKEMADLDLGVVDPRMAAETISVTFLQSVLRGMQRSPQILNTRSFVTGALGVESVSCLVLPDGCIGLPTLAALRQGIPVVAVRENTNIMNNNLKMLPWASNQLFYADNYWEAAGIVASLRAGIDPYTVRRPLHGVRGSNTHKKKITDDIVSSLG